MYVPYHMHTKYSVGDGAATSKAYVKKCKQNGIKALGVTEHGNCFSWIEHAEACQEEGIKPLLGMEAYTFDKYTSLYKKPGTVGDHAVLIAMNDVGYKNILLLADKSTQTLRKKKPHIPKELILEHNEGLIMTTACRSGVLAGMLLNNLNPYDRVREYEDAFKDRLFYEIQPSYEPEQRIINDWIIEHCPKDRITVATDSHYVNDDDWEIQKVVKYIVSKMGPMERHYHLWTYDELVNWEEPIPRYAIDNTNKISDMVDFVIPMGHHVFPKVDIDDDYRSEFSYLSYLAKKGLMERVPCVSKTYIDRLEYELSVIKGNGTAPYFIMNYNIFNNIRNAGIIYGPRGSACGSLVAFCVYIHDIDPIKHGIMFERFMTPGRKSLPDIDIDFCKEDRPQVIQIVKDMYGEDNVSRIISFSTLKLKAVIRDTASPLDIDKKDVEDLKSKVKTDDEGNEISYADLTIVAKELIDNFKTKGDNYTQWLKYIETLAGIDALKSESMHACGIIVSPCVASNLWPVTVNDNKGVLQQVVQFNMESIEKAGGIKMDFLALDTLTLPRIALSYIGINANDIPLNDGKVYEFMSKDSLHGIFQAASFGMKDLIRDMKPHCLNDLAVATAAYRPAVLKLKLEQAYIERKNGSAPVTYLHQDLEKVLKDTYGIFLYQDHTLQTCKLIGMNDQEADDIRKAASKKKYDKMKTLKVKFMEKATTHGWDKTSSNNVWEVFEKGASYGFNFSHALTYGRWMYISAWIKYYFPEIFYAVSLTMRQEASGKSKEAKLFSNLLSDCVTHGVNLLPPNINTSTKEFMYIPQNKSVLYSLLSIKEVGSQAIDWIMENRPFRNFKDFLCKLDHVKVFDKIKIRKDTTITDLHDKFVKEQEKLSELPKRVRSIKTWLRNIHDTLHTLNARFTNSVLYETLMWVRVPKVKFGNAYYDRCFRAGTAGFGAISHVIDLSMFGSEKTVINTSCVVSLIKAGAFDSIIDRESAMKLWYIHELKKDKKTKRVLLSELTILPWGLWWCKYPTPVADEYYKIYHIDEHVKIEERKALCGYGFAYSKYTEGDYMNEVENGTTACVTGEVTKMKLNTTTKTGKSAHYIWINNNREEVWCFIFNNLKEIEDTIKVGDGVKVIGTKKSDRWTDNKNSLFVKTIEKL